MIIDQRQRDVRDKKRHRLCRKILAGSGIVMRNRSVHTRHRMMCNLHVICTLSARVNKGETGYGDAQWAKMPFRPLREKEAEKFVLYGVLSLLNRILDGRR